FEIPGMVQAVRSAADGGVTILTAPLLRDVAPELEAELARLLAEIGEHVLAKQVKDLRIFDRCRCGDSFCSTFYTVPNRATPHPPGFRTLALRPGELHLDVIDATILEVEVLYRGDLKRKIRTAVP
ncbi:MAG TPA: hypothetical protein VGL72_11660, partial [Bryobacteraceae bacterium]